MGTEGKNDSCCGSSDEESTCCKVESVVSVDERGQMVLPKDIRDRAGIGAGDKLAVVAWERDDEICCITLVKVEGLAEMVKGHLGPIMKDVLE
jgi:AbrB family looped-hinge helix DNA binding protein